MNGRCRWNERYSFLLFERRRDPATITPIPSWARLSGAHLRIERAIKELYRAPGLYPSRPTLIYVTLCAGEAGKTIAVSCVVNPNRQGSASVTFS